MLLTLTPTSQNGIQRPYDHSRFRQYIPTLRSPSPSTPEHPASAPPSRPADSSMDSSRSSLPHPSSLTLPPPDVGFSTMPPSTTNQQLPPPPSQWQSSDDAMHHWLRAKAEEDRRKQEEEKTRQETLRLEQRRVEQSMLRDSLNGGIPPHIVPLIFFGICQNGLPQPVIELAQQYLAQVPGARTPNPPIPQVPSHSHSHSHSHSNSHSRRQSMHTRRDSRSGSLSSSYAPQSSAQHAAAPPPPPNILLSQNAPPNTSAPPTPQAPGARSLPTGPPDSRGGVNPWINYGSGAQPQPGQINLGNVQYAPGSSVPVSQVQRRPNSQSRRSPPSLYFHHWVPPAQPQSGVTPGKPHQELPTLLNNSRRSEHHASPGRKRKAPGPHQPPPVPSSRPSESLPGLFQTSRPGSPQNDGQQIKSFAHHRQLSATSVAHSGHHLEDIKVEHTGEVSPSQISTVLPRHASTGHDSAGQKRSDDPLPISDSDKNYSRVFQGPGASTAETRLHDSSIEGNTQHSPAQEAPLPPTQLRDASRE
ncbi:uncharacterized protein APUU_30427A [Aspergillus puulaauensis]|uniref:Uncharacterized protein n=1 Tax=Aspergillus puulaauensis TaxID=1220207 RepID=A0A7R7XJ19_9EURO|nr:uncharacterized protein APUU_30427A [Aspergillus puulaauensis]BCS22202.1 hypothetical protein APUU_30427A [Aspergillus puulaauensis]